MFIFCCERELKQSPLRMIAQSHSTSYINKYPCYCLEKSHESKGTNSSRILKLAPSNNNNHPHMSVATRRDREGEGMCLLWVFVILFFFHNCFCERQRSLCIILHAWAFVDQREVKCTKWCIHKNHGCFRRVSENLHLWLCEREQTLHSRTDVSQQ